MTDTPGPGNTIVTLLPVARGLSSVTNLPRLVKF